MSPAPLAEHRKGDPARQQELLQQHDDPQRGGAVLAGEGEPGRGGQEHQRDIAGRDAQHGRNDLPERGFGKGHVPWTSGTAGKLATRRGTRRTGPARPAPTAPPANASRC